ncbi:hypothetical protein GBA52_026352 [Prunus armeniaca]|nr:hypothetical protein GBA52_026352 [Prunus armeniaca]
MPSKLDNVLSFQVDNTAWIWMDGDVSKSTNDMSCAAIDFYLDLFLFEVHGIIDPFGSTNNSCLVWTKQ